MRLKSGANLPVPLQHLVLLGVKAMYKDDDMPLFILGRTRFILHAIHPIRDTDFMLPRGLLNIVGNRQISRRAQFVRIMIATARADRKEIVHNMLL